MQFYLPTNSKISAKWTPITKNQLIHHDISNTFKKINRPTVTNFNSEAKTIATALQLLDKIINALAENTALYCTERLENFLTYATCSLSI